MVKNMYNACMALILLLLCSCQSNFLFPATPTPTVSLTSTSTPTSTRTPTLTPSLTPTLDTQGESIYYNAGRGQFWVYNLGAQQLFLASLGDDCDIMPRGQDAVCNSMSSTYILDLKTREKIEIPIEHPIEWRIITEERLIYDNMLQADRSESEYAYDILEYDVTQRTETLLATIRHSSGSGYWMYSEPEVSRDGKHIVGQLGASKLVEIAQKTSIPITLNANILGTITDLAWSPASRILGVGSTQIWPGDVGFVCLTTIFSTYNLISGRSELIARAPDRFCYMDFRFSAKDIWSPDGTKVALIAYAELSASGEFLTMGDTDLCIIDIKEKNQNCLPITNPNDGIIDEFVWSPDSKSLAYLVFTGFRKPLGLYQIFVDDSSRPRFLGNIPPNQNNDGPLQGLIWTKP